LTSTDAVRTATADILARANALRPEARISGVIVQAMIVRPKARELILGLADDPTFGTVIVFGHGGTAVEIINDKALALPPLDLHLASELIERTRVSRYCAPIGTCQRSSRTSLRWFWSSFRRWRPIFPRYASSTSTRCWRMRRACWRSMRASRFGERHGNSVVQARPTSRCGLIRRNGSGISRSGTAGRSLRARFVPRMSR
jgi:hypothetical protein